MCAPMAIGLLGSAVSAMGAMSAANGEAEAAEYNAKVEKINARSRRWEGLSESEKIANKYDKLEGEQRVALAKSNVDPYYGSASAIFHDTAEARGADQSTNYLNSESEAIGHENKAKAYELEARNRRQAGKMQAASSLIGGLGSAVKGGGGFGSILKVG